MNKKIISFILTFFVLFNSFKFSYAEENNQRFAPAVVAVAPEIVSTISAFIVAAGGTITGQKMLNDITRHFYNDNESNWDNVVEIFKNSVSITEKGLVKIGSDFLNLLVNTFDKLSIKNTTNEGQDISVIGSYYSIPVLNTLPPHTSNGNCLIDNIGPKIYTTMSYGNLLFDCDTFGDDRVFIKNKSTNQVLCRSNNNRTLDMQYFFYNDYLYSYFYNPWMGGTYCSELASFDSIDTVILDLPSLSISSNLKLDSDNSICVGVPSTLDKFIDGTLNYENIYNPNYDTTIGNVGLGSLPGVSNPSIDYGESITIPGSVVDVPDVDVPDVDVPDVDVPDVDVPGVNDPDVIFPPFPSFGDSLDFSPMYLTNINEKFPFSLPWDIGRLIQKFDIEPKAPIFKVPIVSSEIELDLTIFDEWANIGRFFVLIGFVLSLILISTKLLG